MRIFQLLRTWIATNPVGIFIYGLMAKWYILIAIPSIMVTYWTLNALKESGYLDTWYREVQKVLNESQSIAKNCIPKLLDVTQRREFIECLENPPVYEKPEYQKNLENTVNNFLTDENTNHPTNPYEDYDSNKQPQD